MEFILFLAIIIFFFMSNLRKAKKAEEAEREEEYIPEEELAFKEKKRVLREIRRHTQPPVKPSQKMQHHRIQDRPSSTYVDGRRSTEEVGDISFTSNLDDLSASDLVGDSMPEHASLNKSYHMHTTDNTRVQSLLDRVPSKQDWVVLHEIFTPKFKNRP